MPGNSKKTYIAECVLQIVCWLRVMMCMDGWACMQGTCGPEGNTSICRGNCGTKRGEMHHKQ
jgi:hypothetical protein